jgi:hypothetical protein
MSRKVLISKINSSTFRIENLSSKGITKISEKFSFLPPGYKYNPKFRLLGLRGVKVSLVKKDGTFPQGLIWDVIKTIKKDLGKDVELSEGVQEHIFPLDELIEIRDDVFSDYYFGDNPVILRDYQLGAVKSAFKNRNGILNLSTGAGKCLDGKTKIKIKIPKSIAKKYNLL